MELIYVLNRGKTTMNIIREMILYVIGIFSLLLTPIMFPTGLFSLWLIEGEVPPIKECWIGYINALKDLFDGKDY